MIKSWLNRRDGICLFLNLSVGFLCGNSIAILNYPPFLILKKYIRRNYLDNSHKNGADFFVASEMTIYCSLQGLKINYQLMIIESTRYWFLYFIHHFFLAVYIALWSINFVTPSIVLLHYFFREVFQLAYISELILKPILPSSSCILQDLWLSQNILP